MTFCGVNKSMSCYIKVIVVFVPKFSQLKVKRNTFSKAVKPQYFENLTFCDDFCKSRNFQIIIADPILKFD